MARHAVENGGALGQGDLLGEDVGVDGVRVRGGDVLHLGQLVLGLSAMRVAGGQCLLHGHALGQLSRADRRRPAAGAAFGCAGGLSVGWGLC